MTFAHHAWVPARHPLLFTVAFALVSNAAPTPAQDLGDLFKKVTGKTKEATEKITEPQRTRGESDAPSQPLGGRG